MEETNDVPITGNREASPVAQPHSEASHEWVITTYRKHCLAQVTAELDEALGGGRGKTHYIPPVLLDMNPVHHRQSLREQVFPVYREVDGDLFDIPKEKIVLEAGSGMGKTTFLKIYQEAFLTGDPHPMFPLPVYFHLGHLPEGSGFDKFFEVLLGQVREVVMEEVHADPDLDLNIGLLEQTIESIIRSNKVLFLLDGLDQLLSEDRFRVYFEIMVDAHAMQSNFVILAYRPFSLGPLATASVVKRGEEAGFRITVQYDEEKPCAAFLGEALNKDVQELAVNNPELLETPILLRMIRDLHANELLEGIKTRTDLYTAGFTRQMQSADPEAGVEWIEHCFDKLAAVSFQLAASGRFQRFEDVEMGFDKSCFLGNNESDASSQHPVLTAEGLIPALDGILQETPTRWEYRHPSFQEYFTARKLSRDPHWQEVVRKHCRDPKWDQVVRFFAGLAPAWNDELYDILLDQGALFPAGNALGEVTQLSKNRELAVGQFLKYQCQEACPQFSRFRVIREAEVIAAWDRKALDTLIAHLLSRQNRDSRILFGVIELLLTLEQIDLHKIIDSQDFEPLWHVESLRDFLSEHQDPAVVDAAVIKKWGEQVTIPAGKFIYQMEADDEDQIDMREFAIMKYPVTNAFYAEFNPNHRPGYPRYSSASGQPVIGINYYEATVFALWLGRRLPTEKEWEKAARGVDGRQYPWGEASGYQPGYTNTADFVIGKTNTVEDYPPGISPYGCYDMAGNVWEWCVQLHAARYTTQKVVRGGSWLNYLVNAKTTFRNSFDPSERQPTVGMRCVTLPHTEIEREPMDEDDL